jgi:hypothetical protein
MKDESALKSDQIQEHKDFLTEKKFVYCIYLSLYLILLIIEKCLYQLKN